MNEYQKLIGISKFEYTEKIKNQIKSVFRKILNEFYVEKIDLFYQNIQQKTTIDLLNRLTEAFDKKEIDDSVLDIKKEEIDLLEKEKDQLLKLLPKKIVELVNKDQKIDYKERNRLFRENFKNNKIIIIRL